MSEGHKMNNDIIEDAIAAGFKHALKGAHTINGTLAEDSVTHCGYYVLDELTKFAALRDARKSEQPDAVNDALEEAISTCEQCFDSAENCEWNDAISHCIKQISALKGE